MEIRVRCACLVVMLMVLGALPACDAPRSPQITRDQALQWHDPIEVRVVRHWDALRHARDPHLSHLIEVEYLGGGSQTLKVGQRFVLPYDRWAMDMKEPPERDAVVMLTPAQWVGGNKR